jgi:hypothetical protein
MRELFEIANPISGFVSGPAMSSVKVARSSPLSIAQCSNVTRGPDVGPNGGIDGRLEQLGP